MIPISIGTGLQARPGSITGQRPKSLKSTINSPPLKNPLQPVDNALEKRGYAEAAVVVKIYKNAENDNGDNDEPFKHIGQQKQAAGYG